MFQPALEPEMKSIDEDYNPHDNYNDGTNFIRQFNMNTGGHSGGLIIAN